MVPSSELTEEYARMVNSFTENAVRKDGDKTAALVVAVPGRCVLNIA